MFHARIIDPESEKLYSAESNEHDLFDPFVNAAVKKSNPEPIRIFSRWALSQLIPAIHEYNPARINGARYGLTVQQRADDANLDLHRDMDI